MNSIAIEKSNFSLKLDWLFELEKDRKLVCLFVCFKLRAQHDSGEKINAIDSENCEL